MPWLRMRFIGNYARCFGGGKNMAEKKLSGHVVDCRQVPALHAHGLFDEDQLIVPGAQPDFLRMFQAGTPLRLGRGVLEVVVMVQKIRL